MMRVGTAFNFQGRRYEPGDRFDVRAVPEHLYGTLTRLYGLEPWPKIKLKKEVSE